MTQTYFQVGATY